ncbi:MAG: hypothetical protein K2P81_01705 [Bacteriovoracaceae bacterium]|nr:hypothetical protein [Bacteriovoracaceae bacterium]
MKKLTPWLVTILILIPAGLITYKTYFLKLSLLPQKVDDVWNYHVSLKPKDAQATSVSFPIPRSGDGLKITDEKIRSKGIDTLVDRNSDSAMLTWLSKEPIVNRVTYSARIDINPVIVKKIEKDFTTVYPKQIKKYLKLPVLTIEEEAAVKLLEGAIFEGGEEKSLVARKAFYYVNEEIQRNIKYKTIVDALNSGKGSPLVKARLYTYLLRRKDVPARIVAMLRLPLINEPPDEKIHLTFANEVFLNNRWIPVDTNRALFGERPDRYLVLHHHFEEIEKTISKKKVLYSIQIDRAVINKFNKAEYRKDILRKGSSIGFLSLYKLSLPVQSIFSTILLIPLGTLVLCLARNIIGVPTFGMFTPILLTLFFKETSLAFGLFFFLAVVAIGCLERYVLDKLFLLAVPRMSIILTLVILLLMIIAFTGLAEVFGASHIGYFPIVIVTSFIERFSIMLTEDGWTNTFKTLLGTLIISILTFALYSFPTLEILMFTNPELLFGIIAILILIGKYKGYRVSEFIRFRDLVSQLKKKAKK